MVNPWVLLGVAVVWGLSLFGVGKWQNTAGRTSERVAWQEKDNAEIRAANTKIKQLTDAARAAEQRSAAEVAAIGESHAKAIETLEGRRRRDVAAARDGAIRLRVNAVCPRSGGSSPAEAGAAPGVGDGAAGIELPRQVTSDLLDLANDADGIVQQLTACQQVILNDRKESP